MAYEEWTECPVTTIKLSCDAWRKRGVVCGNTVSVTSRNRDAAIRFMYVMPLLSGRRSGFTGLGHWDSFVSSSAATAISFGVSHRPVLQMPRTGCFSP